MRLHPKLQQPRSGIKGVVSHASSLPFVPLQAGLREVTLLSFFTHDNILQLKDIILPFPQRPDGMPCLERTAGYGRTAGGQVSLGPLVVDRAGRFVMGSCGCRDDVLVEAWGWR